MTASARRPLLAAALATALAASPTAATAATPPTAPQFGPHGPGGGGRAVFVQTDSPGGNQVIVFDEHLDGRLSERETVSTGGLGGQAAGAAVDELASQSSLVYDAAHQLLFAVNAGSDTLSVLSARGRQLRLLQVVNSGGSFPDSIAVSGNLVYVLDAGGTGTLSGYRLQGDRLFTIPGSSRSLGFDNSDPPNYLQSPGQVGFTPNGSELIVTTKASTSSLDVFSVTPAGLPSPTPAVTPDPGNVPFAFTFSPTGQFVVAEAGPSALHTFTLGAGGSLTSLSASVADGQTALCWVTGVGADYYVANAGSNTVSAYTVAGNGTPSLVGATGVVATTDTGPIDLAASTDSHTLYVEAGGAGAVDEFHVNPGGSLTDIGSVTGLGAGIEGIATD
ncbi:MAG: lactonase family protein [Acidimicrobiaceae bacterium]|nr:lactonase family protein [Acidimicrobiaceae bacterium]